MIEKPEKRTLSKDMLRDYLQYDKGYNRSCDEWKAWLEQFIETIKTNSYMLTFKSFDDYRKTVIKWLEEGLK